MFESLANYVVSLSEEQLTELALEDMALCLAWHDSLRETPEKQAPFKPLLEKAEQWAQVAQPPPRNTEGHRQQPLLRELIGAVQHQGIENLKLDEADFLYFVWTLVQQAGEPPFLRRLAGVLRPFLPMWERRREGVLELSPGLPSIAERMMVFTPEDLRIASARDIPNFGGIAPYRGPVLVHQGNAKILGGVPEGSAVNIEGGYCCVTGLVIGMAAATGNCEVRDNVSGVVVSHKENVHCATLLDQCTAIAKEGEVVCISAENPRIVFGGTGVRVRDNSLGGVIMGPEVEVGGEVVGGELSATGTVTAARLRSPDERPLAVVLRRMFSCRDYGEILNADASRMLSSLTKLRQRRTNIARMEEICEREADEFAGNVLFYLFGESDTSHRIQEIEKLRGRLAFINRLKAGGELFASAAEEQLSMPITQGSDADAKAVPAAIVDRDMIEELRRELMNLAQEARIDRDLYNIQEEVIQEGSRLQRVNRPRADITTTLQKLSEQVWTLEGKAGELQTRIAKREKALESALGRGAILERAKQSRTRVAVVDQLLEAGRSQKDSEALRRRVKDRYVSLMRRNIQNRISSVSAHRMACMEVEEKMDRLRKKLWVEYQVSIPPVDDAGPGPGAEVTGRFGDGVRICAWRHLADQRETDAPGLCVTEDFGDDLCTFRRSPRGGIVLVRQEAAPEQPGEAQAGNADGTESGGGEPGAPDSDSHD